MNNYYELYIDACYQLAATMVIKSVDTANAMNQYVTDYFGSSMFDGLDPTTWKYYLNISGQYHPTDVDMTVVSLDTLETITFNKENLTIHVATAAAYVYGTYLYNQLVARYPTQQTLILGILYPVDINTAIAADDGTILGYPPGLVEPNEYSLVANLQTWLNGFRARWYIPAFALTDPLYSAAFLGIMYLNLLPAIISFRQDKCKTNEAHSFHVTMYLASHQGLDVYMPYLTLEQSLWFYRNIAYIERNAGKQEIFDLLVQNIMTVRGLPLSEIVMHHDLTNQPTNLYPDLVFLANPINLSIVTDSAQKLTLDEVLGLEDPLAPGNPSEHTVEEPAIETLMQNSLSNQLLTKIVISNVVDYSNSTPITLPEVLLYHWLYLATNSTYIANIVVTNPRTGDVYSFSAQEAFVFMWYAQCYVAGINLVNIPPVFAQHVQRIPMVNVAEIMKNVDTTLVDTSRATEGLSVQPAIPAKIVSTAAFYNTCNSIYNAIQIQRGLTASVEHYVRRGMVQGMFERIYCDKSCVIADNTGQTYLQWFAARNINIANFTTEDLSAMATTILSLATGANLNTSVTIGALQAALLKMLTQLSSYSIQPVGEINADAIKKLDTPQVRVGNVDMGQSLQYYHPDTSASILSYNTNTTIDIEEQIPVKSTDAHISTTSVHNIAYQISNVTHSACPEIVINMRALISRVEITGPDFLPSALTTDELNSLIAGSALINN